MRRIFVVLVLICGLMAVALSQDRPRSTQPAAPAPSPTPTPTPTDRGVDRIAPTLGEPPPVPKLKPTPTPTPPETLDPDSIVRINAELVQLHVRVIDRNNRPINDVPKNAVPRVRRRSSANHREFHARGSARLVMASPWILPVRCVRSCKA